MLPVAVQAAVISNQVPMVEAAVALVVVVLEPRKLAVLGSLHKVTTEVQVWSVA